VVGAEEHVLKNPSLLYHAGWAKHYREIPSKRKKGYMRRFPDRFSKTRNYLRIVRVFTSIERCLDLLGSINPVLVLVDDKLVDRVREALPSATVVAESRVQHRHHRLLITLADNLANYFRIILREDPGRLRENLKRFEK
jgi:hypothetical protein